MGLLYAALFTCIATTCAWQTQMTTKNPENNPCLNDPALGPLQSAWKAISKTHDESFILLFRSKNHEPNITCVRVTATVHDQSLKISNFTRTYYNKTAQQNESLEYQVRALNQTGYKLENVIRAGWSDIPIAPTPLGSNMYIEYGDYSCNSSSLPLSDMVRAAQDAVEGDSDETEPEEGYDYLDFYVVYSQPSCNIFRSPFLSEGCDFWLKESELKKVLRRAEKKNPRKVAGDGKQASTAEKEKINPAEEIFKSLPTTCRYAFISACGYPKDLMYDKNICNNAGAEKA
ncbi:uncharacterized protein LOC115331964 [Ixodes scapularis]|uniref:uncharacterized protein LOC115331964 n=1 Tax=Ixodes scapularis TaxID=6945 RepID=UPI001A9E8666|nr:uncharacterized protein LOC115331964 [Ixodes scapularis]